MTYHRFGSSSTDTNQTAIVQALRAVGATVEIIRHPVDLLVGFQGQTLLLEVKGRTGKLTDDQVGFWNTWRGGMLAIVRCPEDALKLIGVKDRGVEIGERKPA